MPIDLPPADRARLAEHLELVTFRPGEVVFEEGTRGRSMYFVHNGHARMTRDGLSLGDVGPGDFFGELGLVLGRPRAATVTAETGVEAWELSREHYLELASVAPDVAVKLLERLLGGVGSLLAKMTENVGTLLRERSLPRRTRVTVTIGEDEREVSTGMRLRQIVPTQVDGAPVVAALVERTFASLAQPLSSNAHITPLTTHHWEGERVLHESLGLLLLEAARRLDPKLRLLLGSAIGLGRRVRLLGATATAELAAGLDQKMRELVAADVPLREEWWTVDEARDYFSSLGWHDAAELLLTVRSRTVLLASYGEVYLRVPGPLLPSTGGLDDFRVVLEDGDLLLVYGGDQSVDRCVTISREMRAGMSQQDRWLATLGIDSVGAFNKTCVRGDVSELIRVAEGFQEKQLGLLADRITERAGEVKLVCISGPSSSGKTTFIKRLKVQLQVNGLNPVGLSLDDYYVDREKTPRGENGDYDFEAVEALRIDLFDEHLRRLLAGETVKTAHFDFPSGTSDPEGGPEVQLGARDILMLEGIHALNGRLFAHCPAPRMARVFICPLTQLRFDPLARMHVSDVRLLRRIVRDRHSRGHSAASNILRWPSVRAGERKHIFPHQHEADFVFDTSLIYEVSVLKVFAERYLLEVPPTHEAYPTAHRLLGLLDHFVTIYPDHVPPTSFLREFIGGSGFEY